MNVADLVNKLVSRMSNRVLVGLPICEYLFLGNGLLARTHVEIGRNEEFLKLASGFAKDIMKDCGLIRVLPRLLKP